MSQNPSACFPPPADYTPRPKPTQPIRTHERGRGARRGRGGGGGGPGRGRYNQPSITFHSDHLDQAERLRNQPRDKFHRTEDDDYFARVQDEEDEDEDAQAEDDRDSDRRRDKPSDDEEDDPLDAYMKSLEGGDETENKSRSASQDQSPREFADEAETSKIANPAPDVERKGIRLDIDDSDDVEESYYKYVEQIKAKKPPDENEGADMDERQEMIEYDLDGNVIGVRRTKREIDPLPAIDHSTITYEVFHKNFYQEHDDIRGLTQEQENELRSKLEIKVSGDCPPKPVCSFAHFKFEEPLMRVIRRSEYTQPTPIQAQAIPAALLGRNIIGIAMTGSGKTAAYVWPMIVHIMGQASGSRGDNNGPAALVLVPTRELALQVYGEAKRFSNSYKLSVVCAYGGGSKYEQSRDLESGADVIVATPGRLIDLIKMNVTNLRGVTYLVLDEADRFFEMGFEAQVRSICNQIRPDRQTLLFSATFKKKIEQLARTVTENPVKIVQKSLGEANEDVTQHVILLSEATKKWNWLTKRLIEFTSAGSVLIFVTRILNAEELHKNLKDFGKETLLLHGDMEQSERNRVITAFKRKEGDVMLATDVAARGLDINHIRTVINYDVARDIDTHIHRVGRTGRAGSKGDAYTLITDKDKEFAGHLVKNLESSNQEVSDELIKLAMQSYNFRKTRMHRRHHSKDGPSSHHSSEGRYSRHDDNRTYHRHNSHHHHHHQRRNHHEQGGNYQRRHSNISGQQSCSDDKQDMSPHRSDHSHHQRDHDHRKRSRWQ